MHKKDEIDFLELIRNPIRLFGLSYIYFLLIGGVIGAYYIWSFSSITRNDIAPIVLSDSSQFAKDVPMQRGALIAPVNVAEVGVPTKELIDKGAILFKANCASCHGDNGMGDGVSAATMTIKPRNFHSAEGWKNGRKLSQMYKTLQEGISASGMPAFNYTPAADRFAILHYVRTFANDFPKDSLSDLLDLEKTYSLSKGTQLPAQIPVKLAMEKVMQEKSGEVKSVDEFCTSMAESKQEELGATIAMRVGRDREKMVTAAMAAKGKSVDEFIRIVSSDPFTIGFKPDVLRLDNNGWNALYAFLSKVNKEKKS
ncbi:MAG: cytochrome c [Bacteroidota bacterium]|jgi:mono/diheme cytochrome c family protein/uncharacterized protein (DUF1778 family)